MVTSEVFKNKIMLENLLDEYLKKRDQLSGQLQLKFLDDFYDMINLLNDQIKIYHKLVDNILLSAIDSKLDFNYLDSQINISDVEIVERYYKQILQNSIYPFQFSKETITEYKPDSKHLIIDYQLPNPNNIPRLEEIKFIKSSTEIREKNFLIFTFETYLMN